MQAPAVRPTTCCGANCSLFARLRFVDSQVPKAEPGVPNHFGIVGGEPLVKLSKLL